MHEFLDVPSVRKMEMGGKSARCMEVFVEIRSWK